MPIEEEKMSRPPEFLRQYSGDTDGEKSGDFGGVFEVIFASTSEGILTGEATGLWV